VARRSRGPGYPGRPRTRPPRNRKASEDRRAILIVAASVLALGGAGALAWVSRTPPVETETGCPRGQLVPDVHTVVLVDQTDALTPRQIDYAKALILLEYQRLPRGGRLTVRPIDADPESVARDFSRCRVRRGEEVAGIATNPDLIEAEFRRSVGDALNGYLDRLETQATAEASPILETVGTVAEARDFGPNVDERRLVLLSDMAQNSARVDQYALPGAYALDAGARELLPRNFSGVDVRVHYLRRPSLARLQGAVHERFWRSWFDAAGADVQLGWGLQLAEDPEPS
jgi:hypothetical protein